MFGLKKKKRAIYIDSEAKHGKRFQYQLLSRLKSDCDYFLGNGNGAEKYLWAGKVDKQIAKMKVIHKSLKEKPRWLSKRQIRKYERLMLKKVKK
jgi:hypothetical protein